MVDFQTAPAGVEGSSIWAPETSGRTAISVAGAIVKNPVLRPYTESRKRMVYESTTIGRMGVTDINERTE